MLSGGQDPCAPDLLGLPVDLVTDKGLMEFARPSVDRDKKLIYERA